MFEENIFLISDNLFNQLIQKAMFFVSPRLIPEGEIISKIRFGENLIEKNEQGWVYDKNTNPEENERLRKFAEMWSDLEASRVSTYIASTSEAEKIILTLENGKSLHFNLLSSEPFVMLARPDLQLQYELNADLSKLVRQTTEELMR